MDAVTTTDRVCGRRGSGWRIRDQLRFDSEITLRSKSLKTQGKSVAGGIRYEERGPAVSEEAKKVRARKMIRELRSLGYRVELAPAVPTA
jgi:hypothetical protein